MKKLFIGLCCSALMLMSGCTSKHLDIFPELSSPDLVNAEIAPERLHQDIDAFIDGVVERHPDLSKYTDLAEVYQQADILKNEITEPMTRQAFFKKVGTLSHYFNDGHTFLIWPYQEYQALQESGKLTFPFALNVFPEGVFLKYGYQYKNSLLPKGAKLLSINGIDIDTIFSTSQQLVGGETEVLRKHVVADRFPMMVWAVFGFVESFDMAFEVDTEIQRVELTSGQQWARVENANDNTQADTQLATSDSDFSYHLINKETGYLKVATFDVSPDWFEDFVDATFEKISQQKVKNLIIDIRENGGGNTDTSTYLASYLAKKPFRMISSMRERLNTDNRGIFNYKGNVGDVLTQEWDDWIAPVDETLSFKGNAYVLISPLSYSSAIVFATAVQDNEMAMLVGRETGGYANQTAQGNLFNLPNSELRVYVATRLLVRPNGNLQVKGVVPDIPVATTSEQIAAGEDADIAAVLAHVNGSLTER